MSESIQAPSVRRCIRWYCVRETGVRVPTLAIPKVLGE